MKKAKIYKPNKSAMQSGLGKLDKWILEFKTNNPAKNPLMGWESSDDMYGELKIEFSTKQLAIDYAKKKKIDFEIIEPKERKIVKKSYADNFLKIKICLNFCSKKMVFMEYFGSIFILVSTWYQVQLDVKINEWFGEFYDTLQKALTTPNSVSEAEFIGYLFTFAKIAALWILIAVFTGFFTSHWVFRWRTSMAEYYHDQWLKARLTEGAPQRVQEDTLKFARIMEGLGTGLLDSIMTLIAFTPILWGLSKQIDVLPWIGEVDHALVWVAILSALGGTLLLAAVGIKLPGIEYDIQKEEAGYRKELVHGEDDPIRAAPPTIGQLYNRVRGIHYKSYFHYLYFNTVKWSYFQGMVIVPYLALAPTIVTGAITLGFVQQITRAFGRVEGSLQYLVKSWSTIVELISVWKRLREFEAKLKTSKMESIA